MKSATIFLCLKGKRKTMSTLLLEINSEQEKALESSLSYMKISFHKISSDTDFWDSLSIPTKERIQKGMIDAETGNFTNVKAFF